MIICGDALIELKNIGSVDVVITDPVWPNCPIGLLPGSEDPQILLAAALKMIECRRLVIILRADSDIRFLSIVPEKWPFFRVQILPYICPGFIGRKLGGLELAYCFGEPLPSGPGRRVIPGMAPKAQPDGNRKFGHPSVRNINHMRWLVHWWSLPGETVLDPFMGTGTIGVACAEMERQFIGIEIDGSYFKIAEKRIADAQAQYHISYKNVIGGVL